MSLRQRALTLTSWLVIVLFVATLGLTFLAPLYTDEIGSRSELSRTLAEGGRLITLLPQCPSSWRSPLPVSWYPGAVLYAALFSWLGLMGLKISGILLVIGLFAAAGIALRRTTS